MNGKKIIASFMVAILLGGNLSVFALAKDQLNYADYLSGQQAGKYTATDIPASLRAEQELSGIKVLENYKGYTEPSYLIEADSSCDFTFTIPQDGYYSLQVDYISYSDSSQTMEQNFYIDGKLPFKELEAVAFERTWKSQKIQKDNLGNDIRPKEEQKPVWQTKLVKDSGGTYDAPFELYLKAGIHILTIQSVNQPIVIGRVRFVAPQSLRSYEETLQEWKKAGYAPVNDIENELVIQAENASLKSDRTMFMLNDNTSPNTTPYDADRIRMNTIGGERYKTAGQWLEWEVDVPKTGLYRISLRTRQNLKTNNTSWRKLYINGKIPFKEANHIGFAYNSGWETKLLGEEMQGWQFLLKEGKNTIRLEVTSGEFTAVLEELATILLKLNTIYRDILVLTGPSPDVYRDYQFESVIPDTLKSMKQVSEQLESIEASIKKLLALEEKSQIPEIDRVTFQLKMMVDDDTTIASRLADLQSNISALASWVYTMKEQPLELDYIQILAANDQKREDKASFWAILYQHIRQFFNSFFTDYAAVGQTGAGGTNPIDVWLPTGRDQLTVLRQLINEDFTSHDNISVNLQLVPAGSLLSATMAGIGPDVALSLGQSDPMNYAFRNAVYDLSNFEDIYEVLERFAPSAIEPFRFEESVYALPETQTYSVLFYRKDILEELGIPLEVLDDWAGILKWVLPELQQKNLQFGLQSSFNTYAMFLFQYGGTIYNQKGTESTLNTTSAVQAFEVFTSIYTDYKQPLAFDFSNRFRSGEMPLAVMDFTTLNQLSIFAPEIKGLWGILPVPGTKNGAETSHQTASGVTACVILDTSDQKKEAWSFMKWWLSEYAQDTYGSELESVMGTAARYPSANLAVIENTLWSKDVKEVLKYQREHTSAIPEVPGGYFTSRNFDFAFRDVVYSNKNLRETLNRTVKTINAEIAAKREEFNLDY